MVGGTEKNGVTKNDKKDADTGPNNLQNFPVLSSAKTSSGTTTIEGTLKSRPKQTFTIQFFSNPSGTDEGQTFLDQTQVTTNKKGKASFTFTPTQAVPAGQIITATATDATSNTSELSKALAVSQP